ncbi:MAG: hypothetical protein WEA09_09265 [Gemmatimonadota bacterium]
MSLHQRRLTPLWAAILLVPALGTPGLGAQDATSLLTDAHARYLQGLSGIQDLTLEQEIFGVTTLTYMVKEEGPDGTPMLRPRLTRTMGTLMPVPEDEEDDGFMGNPGAFLHDLTGAARVEGQGTVDGRRVHVIVVDDPGVLDLDPIPQGGVEGTFRPTRAALHLDASEFLLLRMEISGEMSEGGATSPVSTRVDFSDYRSVGGYHHPHSIRIQMDLPGSVGGSAELEEARSAMAEIQAQMERMDPEQRAMMEGQLGALEEMLGGNGEGMTMEIRTLSAVANQGPPPGS